RPPRLPLLPYTTPFRSERAGLAHSVAGQLGEPQPRPLVPGDQTTPRRGRNGGPVSLVRKLTMPEWATLSVHERGHGSGLFVVPDHEAALVEAGEARLGIFARSAAHRSQRAHELV